jgi:hypothetical protein
MRSELSSTESIYSQENPPVVKEYMMSSMADREVFDETLQKYKLNTQLKSKEGWYGFKAELLEKIRGDVEEVYLDMVNVSLFFLARWRSGLMSRMRGRWIQ